MLTISHIEYNSKKNTINIVNNTILRPDFASKGFDNQFIIEFHGEDKEENKENDISNNYKYGHYDYYTHILF